MQLTFNAYGGQRLHEGPGFSMLSFSDQDIHSALTRMVSAPEFMPGFLRWHRLSPASCGCSCFLPGSGLSPMDCVPWALSGITC